MPFFCLIYQFSWKFSVHQKHKIINHENIYDFNDNGLEQWKFWTQVQNGVRKFVESASQYPFLLPLWNINTQTGAHTNKDKHETLVRGNEKTNLT